MVGKIFYMIGRSASGKDSLLRALFDRFGSSLKPVLMYTTRPIRSGETDGISYHFVDEARIAQAQAEGILIEKRTYQTVHGPWTYATLEDGQIDLTKHSYLMAGTLESCAAMLRFYGDAMVPLYIYVEEGELLARALKRERAQQEPKYEEMCRRFLADSADFAPDKLRALGIEKAYENADFDSCLNELATVIEEATK